MMLLVVDAISEGPLARNDKISFMLFRRKSSRSLLVIKGTPTS